MMRMAEGRSVMTSGHDVYDDGVLRVMRTGSPPVVVIAGEIDESNYAGLVGTLDRLVDGLIEVHVNLAKVDFCDLAGLRAIVRLTEIGREGHELRVRRLVLHEAPRQVRRVLQIMGWDTIPGLIMNESS